MLSCTVLTGDLIGSTELSSEELENRLTSVKIALDEWWDNDNSRFFTRRSGDGWQAIISPPERALRAALFIRAWMKRRGADRDTRIYFAEGEIEVPTSGNLNDATEAAFIESGRGLETLTKKAQFGHSKGGSTAAAFRLADHISQGWTKSQARVMQQSLHPRITQSRIADHLGITQQSVQQTQAAAGFPALNDALTFIETSDA